jgi:hypothetical protein
MLNSYASRSVPLGWLTTSLCNTEQYRHQGSNVVGWQSRHLGTKDLAAGVEAVRFSTPCFTVTRTPIGVNVEGLRKARESVGVGRVDIISRVPEYLIRYVG